MAVTCSTLAYMENSFKTVNAITSTAGFYLPLQMHVALFCLQTVDSGDLTVSRHSTQDSLLQELVAGVHAF